MRGLGCQDSHIVCTAGGWQRKEARGVIEHASRWKPSRPHTRNARLPGKRTVLQGEKLYAACKKTGLRDEGCHTAKSLDIGNFGSLDV